MTNLDESFSSLEVASSTSGFYEDLENHTFGTTRKGCQRPLSNFTFEFLQKIDEQSNTGYLVHVTPEGNDSEDSMDEHSRTTTCYFTSDATMKKERFMQQLNFANNNGFTCSFNDYQLAEFIQHKRRNSGKLPVKSAVCKVGPQPDKTWVLGPSLYFNEKGDIIDSESSQYIWISHLYEGPGVARQATACDISLPLSTKPLEVLYTWTKRNMNHNFIPAMLVAGSSAMAMHYKTILTTFLFCPVPLAFSEKSGTGKTSSIIIGLGPTGAYPSRFISRASYEKYSQLCAVSFLPLGIDDPKSKVSISDLVVSLFNGAKEATIKHGEQNPNSMAVISANFTPVNQEKYLSRCLLIEFFEPSLDISMLNYAELPNLVEKSNSAVGHFIGLGFKFLDVGIKEMDDIILPKLRMLLGNGVIPRCLPSYAILIWFTLEVGKIASINLEDDVYQHFEEKMVPKILALQATAGNHGSTPASISMDDVGEEIIKVCQDLHIFEIWKFLRTDVAYNHQPVMAIRVEDMPQPLKPDSIKLISDSISNKKMGVKEIKSCTSCTVFKFLPSTV